MSTSPGIREPRGVAATAGSARPSRKSAPARKRKSLPYAVMAQRHLGHDGLDDFPTYPFATRALCEGVIDLAGMTV